MSTTPRRRWRRLVVIALAVPVIVAAAGLLALRLFQPHLYSGTVLQAPEIAPPMEGLTLVDGSPVDLVALQGDVVLVYFGYTHCPDVCPTTLSKVAHALDEIGDDADRVHVLVVTVDPERDLPETLETYVTSFDPRMRGVSGSMADTERTASLYGVFFAPGERLGDGYAVDHTATLMGIDTEGHLRIVWPNSLTVSHLASDLEAML
jgi:protein SCO1